MKTKTKLSYWIIIDGYCATRIVEGGDIDEVADRVAFIEKTPRVRVEPYDHNLDWLDDCHKWESGPKGSSNSHEDANDGYGFDQESRDWCDKRLVEMGYEICKSDLSPDGVTYIICSIDGRESRWGIAAHPQNDTTKTLKAHLAKYRSSAVFVEAVYHDINDKYVFTYGDEPNSGFDGN